MTSDGIYCPYCGEWIDLFVDPGGATRQEYIEDCSVCCRPINVRVVLDRETGEASIIGTSDDD